MQAYRQLFIISIVLVIMGWCPAISFASLGDNELKVSEKYGQPAGERKLSESLVERSYRFNGLAVTVTFLNGTSQCEMFRKLDGTPLADGQIQSLLGENSNNLSWTPKTSASQSVREWMIAGPVPSSEPASGPVVLALSPKHVSAEGTRMVAVDARAPNANASSAPAAPPVLRRAIYKSSATGNALSVFTSAYEQVSKHELR